MKLTAFIKDKCLLLLLHAVCMILLYSFLGITGYGRDSALLILLVWGLILSVAYGMFFLQGVGMFFGVYLVYFVLTYVGFKRNIA